MRYDLAQLQSLTRQAGWPESLIAKAAAIWWYESGGDPNAHNPDGENSHGLAQINLPFHPTMTVAKARDPLTALRYAYKLYKARPDWGDWYNSNKKYNNNYQGIAAKSRAIYASGGGSANVITEQQVLPIVAAASSQNAAAAFTSNDKLLIGGALALLLVGVVVSRN